MSLLRQRSTILEIIPWTQNAYTLLYQPGHKDALFVLKSESKSTKTTHPCVEADIEYAFCIQGIISKFLNGLSSIIPYLMHGKLLIIPYIIHSIKNQPG